MTTPEPRLPPQNPVVVTVQGDTQVTSTDPTVVIKRG